MIYMQKKQNKTKQKTFKHLQNLATFLHIQTTY